MAIIKFIPSTENPTKLSARYEIRQLTPEHLEWAKAIVCHSNIFHSPIWPIAYPDNKIQRLHRMMSTCSYLISHQIASGMSFGVFDTEYVYKNSESATTQGALYWDPADLHTDSAKLLELMDFPLCSVALAYDGINQLDMPQMMPLIEVLPLFATLYHLLEVADQRDPEAWKPKAEKEVLMRNATSTRADYEGKKLMGGLARWLMKEAARNGFRGVQIEGGSDAVTHVWMHPPEPFSAELIGKMDTALYLEDDAEGNKFKPFGDKAKQVITKIYVTLDHKTPKPTTNGTPVGALA